MASPSPLQMIDLAGRLQEGGGDPTPDPEAGWGDYKRWMDARLPEGRWMGPHFAGS